MFQPMRPPPEEVACLDADAYSYHQLLELVGLNPKFAHEITEEDLRAALRQVTLQTHPDRVAPASTLKSGKHFEFYRACVEKLRNGAGADRGFGRVASTSAAAAHDQDFEEFLRRARAQELASNPSAYRYDAPAPGGSSGFSSGCAATSAAGGKRWSNDQINAHFELRRGEGGGGEPRSAFQRIADIDPLRNVPTPRNGKQINASFDAALHVIAGAATAASSSSSSSSAPWVPKVQALPGGFDTGGLMSSSLFDPNGRNRRRCSADDETVNVFAPSCAGNHIEDVFDPRRALAASARAATATHADNGSGMSVEAYNRLRDASLDESYGSKESHQAILEQMQYKRQQEYEQKMRQFYAARM